MADIKNFLYAWCGKKKITPNYDIRAAGNKNRQKFVCEVRIRLRLQVIYIDITHTHTLYVFCSWRTVLNHVSSLRCVWRVTITLAWEIPPTRRMLSPMLPEIL